MIEEDKQNLSNSIHIYTSVHWTTIGNKKSNKNFQVKKSKQEGHLIAPMIHIL